MAMRLPCEVRLVAGRSRPVIGQERRWLFGPVEGLICLGLAILAGLILTFMFFEPRFSSWLGDQPTSIQQKTDEALKSGASIADSASAKEKPETEAEDSVQEPAPQVPEPASSLATADSSESPVATTSPVVVNFPERLTVELTEQAPTQLVAGPKIPTKPCAGKTGRELRRCEIWVLRK